jgi:hypothetical protein
MPGRIASTLPQHFNADWPLEGDEIPSSISEEFTRDPALIKNQSS